MILIDIPPSKSITHRALFCAALAKGRSILRNPLLCDDTAATVEVLENLGIKIEKFPGRWVVHGGTLRAPSKPLDCRESGTTWRFLTAITDCLKIPCTFSGSPQLLGRGQRPDPETSSQYLSGLLLAAPCGGKKETISFAAPPVSQPYIALTLSVQEKFGITVKADENFSRFEIAPQNYRPTEITIEKDWSSAAFFIAAGILSQPLTLSGLNPESLQADRAIETIAKEMGGKLEWDRGDLKIFPSRLKAIAWDFSQTPDLYPVVAVLSACARGKSRFSGIENLQFKESNRIEAMQKLLRDFKYSERSGREGGPDRQTPSSGRRKTVATASINLPVEGALPAPINGSRRRRREGEAPPPLAEEGATQAPIKDHRIIMAAAVLGLVNKERPTPVCPESVSKSFPDFWKEWTRLTKP